MPTRTYTSSGYADSASGGEGWTDDANAEGPEDASVATFVNTAAPPPTPATGWTEFELPVGNKAVYVSSSGGDDGDDGLTDTTPKETIAAAQALMNEGDWLLLKCGDTFQLAAQVELEIGGDTEYALHGTYGDEATLGRAILEFTGDSHGVVANGVNKLAIVNWEIRHTDNLEEKRGGMILLSCNDLLLEGLYVHGWGDNIVVQDAASTGAIQVTGLKIRRCISTGAINPFDEPDNRAQGIYLGGCTDPIIEECILDRNGLSETIFARNCYVHESGIGGTFRYNVSARGGSDGLQQRPGGTNFNNLYLISPYGMTIGSKGGDIDIDVQHNVCYGAANISDSERRGTGFLIHDGDNGATFKYNIGIHNTLGSGEGNCRALQFQTHGEIAYNYFRDWRRIGATNGHCVVLYGSNDALEFHHNTLAQIEGTNQILLECESPRTPATINAHDNVYDWDDTGTWDPFRPYNSTGWQAAVGGGDVDSTFNVAVANPNSELHLVLAAVLGGSWASKQTLTVDEYIDYLVATQRKGTWNEDAMPAVINNEVRDRCGVANP